MIKRICSVAAALLLAALIFLFFTNDFGIVDIHETSIVMAVGIDGDGGDGLKVTAQLAVPRPSQSGEAVEYVEVQGAGPTVADAFNEINSKTGVYPKLHFLKIIILGEGCVDRDIFATLDYFYRGEYSQLTPLVAACKGEAAKLLAMPAPASDTASMPIEKALSEELKKAGNVATVNLKLLAQDRYSVSAASYMPYIEFNKQGTSESGSGVGGEQPEEESSGSSGGGGSGESSGGSGGSGSSGGSGGQGDTVEFTCKKIAMFNGGKLAGILDEDQSFAFNLVSSRINRAVYTFSYGGKSYSFGLRGNINGISLRVEDGNPVLKFKLVSKAELIEVSSGSEPEKTAKEAKIDDKLLAAAENSIKERLASLVDAATKANCDVFGAARDLHKYEYKYYASFKDNLLSRVRVEYDVRLRSAV